MKALTFKQYRIIDLTLLSVLYIISETVITLMSVRFPWEAYSLSLAIVFMCLGLMRWSGYAAIFAVIGGIDYCIAYTLAMNSIGKPGATPSQFAIYCIGNLFALLAILLFKIWSKEKIRTSKVLSIVFVICVYILVELGRSCVSLIFELNIKNLVAFLATDALSGVFALVVIMAVRNLDGIFEDQKAYLLRVDAERQKELEKERQAELINSNQTPGGSHES